MPEANYVFRMSTQALIDAMRSCRGERKLYELVRRDSAMVADISNGRNVVRIVQAVPALKVLRVVRLAHKLGVKLPSAVHENAAYSLAMAKHWNLVLHAVASAERKTTRLLNWRIQALFRMQVYAPLTRFLDEFSSHKCRPNRQTFHLLIVAALRNHNLALARSLLAKMDEAGFPPDASTHSLITLNYRDFGWSPDVQHYALQNLGGIGRRATAVLNALIQLRIDAGDLSKALDLISFFDESSVAPILAAFSRQQQHTDSVLPNASTYAIFINHAPNLPTALHLLDKMIHMGIQPTVGTIVALINVYFAAGAGTTAVRLVAQMSDRQEMFVPLISDSHHSPPLPLVTAGFKAGHPVFNALLKGALQVHGLSATTHILRIMHANNVLPDATTLYILISHLSKAERAPPATLFRLLSALSSPAVRPGVRHLHTILSAVVRHEQYLKFGIGWNTSAAPFSRTRSFTAQLPTLQSDKLSGTSDNLGPVAGIHLSRKSSYGSRRIIQSLSQRNVRSDGPMFALRIKRDAVLHNDMPTAKDVFKMLLVRGIQANEYHFSALMHGFASAGNLHAATGVLTSAIQAGVKPNAIMSTILIVGYARQGKPEDAVKVFQHMVATNIRPDIPSIDALASAFFAVGAYATARRCLITMWPYIQPFPEDYRNLSLKDLVQRFRLMHAKQTGHRSLSKEQKTALYRGLATLVRRYKGTRSKRRFCI